MSKIIALGNALVDVMTILQDDNMLNDLHLPKGSMQLVDNINFKKISLMTNNLQKSISTGGSSANTIRSLSKLGIATGFIGKIGNDELGDFFMQDMKDCGVSTRLIRSNDSHTGTAIALISKDSERTFATYLGAASELSDKEINKIMFDDYDILHVEGYLIFNHELIEQTMSLAKDNGLLVSLDLASYNIVEDNLDFLKYLIEKYVDIIFANEMEAKAFTGLEPEAAVLMLSKICDIAIVKIGDEGSIIKKGDVIKHVNATKSTAIDTTGAGDNYAAGFLYGLVNNLDIERCAKIGSLLAGNVIEVIGTTMDEKRWLHIKNEISKII